MDTTRNKEIQFNIHKSATEFQRKGDYNSAEKANVLAFSLPHTREKCEVIRPLIQEGLNNTEIDMNIKNILLGDGHAIQ